MTVTAQGTPSSARAPTEPRTVGLADGREQLQATPGVQTQSSNTTVRRAAVASCSRRGRQPGDNRAGHSPESLKLFLPAIAYAATGEVKRCIRREALRRIAREQAAEVRRRETEARVAGHVGLGATGRGAVGPLEGVSNVGILMNMYVYNDSRTPARQLSPPIGPEAVRSKVGAILINRFLAPLGHLCGPQRRGPATEMKNLVA